MYASDEFSLVAGRTPQPAGEFESLDQAENGIGLVAAFVESFAGHADMDRLGTGFFQSVDGAPALGYRAPRTREVRTSDSTEGRDVALLTGEYAAPILRDLLDRHRYDDVRIITVENRYFGGNIKVAGLMTGQDIQRVLADVPTTTTCLLPDVCLSEGRFLDGLSVEDLPHPVTIVRTTGQDLRSVLEHVRTKGLVHS